MICSPICGAARGWVRPATNRFSIFAALVSNDIFSRHGNVLNTLTYMNEVFRKGVASADWRDFSICRTRFKDRTVH